LFFWMLHMFHTHVVSIYSKCFICFKCMLHSSISCCKCRPSVLVSMRAGRAKPQPPTRGGVAGRRQLCGEEAHAARYCCGRGGGESFGRTGRDGAVPVWKMRERVIRAAWAVDLKPAVHIRA
jgi:hypothetical protein